MRFHLRNMLETGFPEGSFRGIWTNETTMYVDLNELYTEFARLLEPGWPVRVHHRLLQRRVRQAVPGGAPDRRALHLHHPSPQRVLRRPVRRWLVPVEVVDLTAQTIPYWELRAQSPVRTGIEEPFLTAYREGSFQYLLIAADRV